MVKKSAVAPRRSCAADQAQLKIALAPDERLGFDGGHQGDQRLAACSGRHAAYQQAQARAFELGDQNVGTDAGAGTATDLPHQRIAGVMALRMVDDAQGADIEHGQCGRSRRRYVQRFRQALLEQPAIRQSSQGIVAGAMRERTDRLLALGLGNAALRARVAAGGSGRSGCAHAGQAADLVGERHAAHAARQQQVHQHQVVALKGKALQRVLGTFDDVATQADGAEHAGEEGRLRGGVLDDQHLAFAVFAVGQQALQHGHQRFERLLLEDIGDAGLIGFDDEGLRRVGGEQDEGRHPALGQRAQAAAQLDPGHVRQMQRAANDSEVALLDPLQRSRRTFGEVRPQAGADEDLDDDLMEQPHAIDEEDVNGAIGEGRASGGGVHGVAMTSPIMGS